MSNHDSQSPELSTNHIITFSADLKYLAADGNENNTHYEHIVSCYIRNYPQINILQV